MLLSCLQISGLLRRHDSTKDVSVYKTNFLQLFIISALSNCFQKVYIDFPPINYFQPTSKRAANIIFHLDETKTAFILFLETANVLEYVMDIHLKTCAQRTNFLFDVV